MSSIAEQVTFDALAIDPYPLLARLRTDCPVAFAPNLNMWLVTDYETVTSVIRDPVAFSNDSPDSTIQQTFGRQMLSVEGDEQKRFKRACLAPFTFAAARDVWRPRIEESCLDLLTSTSQPRVDLMSTLAQPIALKTMGIVLGLNEPDLPKIRGWYESFAAALANFEGDAATAQRGQQAASAMRAYLTVLLEQASGQPLEATLISKLAIVEGDRLNRVEILNNLLIVLFGGIETTESMIGNTLWWLFCSGGKNAPLVSQLRATQGDSAEHSLLLDRIIEESLRFEPAVQSLTRHATVGTVVSGQKIGPGEIVQCMIGGANRDPARFSEPDRFDIDRANNQEHLSFGMATHFCLGAQLARMETKCALRALFRCCPGFGFLETESSPPYGHEFRKPAALWVSLP